MDIDDIKARVKIGNFRVSLHAEMEAEKDNLDIAQIVEAIINDHILEEYEDTGRGESCLVVGFSDETPIHVVCGMRAENVIIVTVYIPSLPKFIDPWTRASVE
ncbi:MAG: DUF4258 domain-containing protein [Caldilineaceae bacterium]|nr:DUF4258 domain-containing protein [Caldilineaceae bacterium]